MGYRSASFKSIYAAPARKRKATNAVLSALPGGTDFLDLCEQVARKLENQPQVDKSNYTKITDVSRQGRDLLITVETGTIGAAAHVRDTASDEVAYTLTADDAPVVSIRCLITLAVGTRQAFACLEHAEHRSSGTMLLKEIHAEWITRFGQPIAPTEPGLTLHIDTIVKPDDWLKAAELESVTAIVRGHMIDLADGGTAKKVGVIRHQLVPDVGQRHLPRWLKKRLMDGQVSKAKTLGLPEELDIDQVVMKLSDDESSKTFVMGRERTPAIRVLLSEPGQPPLSDVEFVRECKAECAKLASD